MKLPFPKTAGGAKYVCMFVCVYRKKAGRLSVLDMIVYNEY